MEKKADPTTNVLNYAVEKSNQQIKAGKLPETSFGAEENNNAATINDEILGEPETAKAAEPALSEAEAATGVQEAMDPVLEEQSPEIAKEEPVLSEAEAATGVQEAMDPVLEEQPEAAKAEPFLGTANGSAKYQITPDMIEAMKAALAELEAAKAEPFSGTANGSAKYQITPDMAAAMTVALAELEAAKAEPFSGTANGSAKYQITPDMAEAMTVALAELEAAEAEAFSGTPNGSAKYKITSEMAEAMDTALEELEAAEAEAFSGTPNGSAKYQITSEMAEAMKVALEQPEAAKVVLEEPEAAKAETTLSEAEAATGSQEAMDTVLEELETVKAEPFLGTANGSAKYQITPDIAAAMNAALEELEAAEAERSLSEAEAPTGMDDESKGGLAEDQTQKPEEIVPQPEALTGTKQPIVAAAATGTPAEPEAAATQDIFSPKEGKEPDSLQVSPENLPLANQEEGGPWSRMLKNAITAFGAENVNKELQQDGQTGEQYIHATVEGTPLRITVAGVTFAKFRQIKNKEEAVEKVLDFAQLQWPNQELNVKGSRGFRKEMIRHASLRTPPIIVKDVSLMGRMETLFQNAYHSVIPSRSPAKQGSSAPLAAPGLG
ncbi:MAG: hypothetical protein PHS57_03525 [Alphaproteobacteria bacterium]|nr:hypothetical protein [Alphaproteobacteria bacterium]